MDTELKREIIMDNYQDPMNKGLVDDDSYIKTNTNSESCIDNLDLYILFEDNVIKDIHFEGEACAISTSATSIMIKLLVNKTISEVKELINNYYSMINGEEHNEELLEEACTARFFFGVGYGLSSLQRKQGGSKATGEKGVFSRRTKELCRRRWRHKRCRGYSHLELFRGSLQLEKRGDYTESQ